MNIVFAVLYLICAVMLADEYGHFTDRVEANDEEAEKLNAIIRTFKAKGWSAEKIADAMNIPVEWVEGV